MIDKATLAAITKEFGEGTLITASSLKKREYRSTGSIALDIALGGGYAKGTIIDVLGKQSSGKTLLFELAAVEAQRSKQPSAIFDFEGTFDPRRFEALGGNLDELYVISAASFGIEVGGMFVEWATDMLKAMLKNKMFACIAMDSTAAMVSKTEYDIKEAKGEEQATMAYTARAISSQLRQIVGTGLLARSEANVFYMSQFRDNIGGRGFKGMPPPDKRTGGRALPFYAANQLEISRGEIFKADVEHDAGFIEKDTEVAHETKVRVRKNKNNEKQGRAASFKVYNEGEVRGLDKIGELTRLAILTHVIKKRGAWYELPLGRDNAQGVEKLTEVLRTDLTLCNHVWTETRKALELVQAATAIPEEVMDTAPEDRDLELMDRMDAAEAVITE